MIRYTLKCNDGHSFESWFQSAAAFETLHKAGHLSCPHCASQDVQKSLMAPRVATARTKQDTPQHEHENEVSPPLGDGSQQTPPASEQHSQEHTPSQEAQNSAPALSAAAQNQPSSQQDIETAVAKMRKHVEKTADYVGDNFVNEARAMQESDAPVRSIYGEAKLEEAKALIEDGVPIIPLPFAPKRKLN